MQALKTSMKHNPPPMTSTPVLRWNAEKLWELIIKLWPDFSVEIVRQTDSTNTRLLERIRIGQTTPTLLVAESQTAARGRMGKTWVSPVPEDAGRTLMFSLTAPFGKAASPVPGGLAIATGCAIAQALDPEGHTLRLKWPNDLWYRAPHIHHELTAASTPWRKLAGILIETTNHQHQRYAVIGIGLNIQPPQGGLGTFSIPPGSLAELDPRWDAPAALAKVLPPLAQAVYNFPSTGIAPWLETFQTRDLLAGMLLTTSDGRQGIGSGLDPHGNLLLATAVGLQTVVSGEVSVRPC